MSNDSKIVEFVDQVDLVLDELSALANSNPSIDVFLDNLLAQTNLILGSKVSAFWHVGPNGNILKSRSCGAKISGEIPTKLKDKIHRCIESKQPQRYKHEGKKQVDIVLWPMSQFVPAAAMALYFKSSISPNEEPVVLRVIAALAELADDYFSSRVVAQRDQLESNYSALVGFSNAVNSDLSVRKTAITIANHSRNILGCDRVSVLSRSGPVYALVASSGVQNVNRRANTSRMLESMTKRVFRKQIEPIVHIQSAENADEDALAKTMGRYCEANGLEVLVLFPILQQADTSKPNFLFVAEYKNKVNDVGSVIHRVNSIEPQIRSALNNSKHYESLPFLGVTLLLKSVMGIFGGTKRLLYSMLCLGLIAMAAFALFFVKTELKVHVRGELVAPTELYVFAPDDGLVSEVLVSHGQQVTKGDPVLVLRSDTLDLEIVETQGKLDIAKKKLASEEVALSAFTQDGTPKAQSALIQLTGETIETKEQISHFENELKVLEIRKSKLVVNSPMDGEIASWNPERVLGGNRPVRRGDRLIQIIETGSMWLAELNVSGDQITHILNDDFNIRDDVEVSLSIASAPDVVLEGKIVEIARVANQSNETDYSNVKIMVEFETEGHDLANLRPGTTVAANAKCGQVSVAYSLFHRILLALRFRFF